jgi:hypothetical protein
VIHIDTEWALTSISQLQFWRNVPPELFGDNEVRGILSVDISDWTAPGSDGRPAMQCTREEVVRETWNQLKRSVNFDRELLRDEDLHSWFLDPDIESGPARPGFLLNSEPLLVNLVDTWALRPEATTTIPNLFLASDYVRTYTDKIRLPEECAGIWQIVAATRRQRLQAPVALDELQDRSMVGIGVIDEAFLGERRHCDQHRARSVAEKVDRLDIAGIIVAARLVEGDQDCGLLLQ